MCLGVCNCACDARLHVPNQKSTNHSHNLSTTFITNLNYTSLSVSIKATFKSQKMSDQEPVPKPEG